MEITSQQNRCIQFLAQLTLQEIKAVQFGNDDILALTSSLNDIFSSGSILTCADLWTFNKFDTLHVDATGSTIYNVRVDALRTDQAALEAVALLSGSLTVVE